MENGDAASNIIISSSETRRSRRFFPNISLYSALAAAILLIITLSSPAFIHKAAPEEPTVQVSSLHVSNFSLSHYSHLITARFEVGFSMSSPDDDDELMTNTDISRVSIVHGGLELASTSETRTRGKGSVVNVGAVMEAHKIWKKEEEVLFEEMEEVWKWKKVMDLDVKVQVIVVSFQDAKSPLKYKLFNLTCPHLPIFFSGKRRDAGRLLGIGRVSQRCLND